MITRIIKIIIGLISTIITLFSLLLTLGVFGIAIVVWFLKISFVAKLMLSIVWIVGGIYLLHSDIVDVKEMITFWRKDQEENDVQT